MKKKNNTKNKDNKNKKGQLDLSTILKVALWFLIIIIASLIIKRIFNGLTGG